MKSSITCRALTRSLGAAFFMVVVGSGQTSAEVKAWEGTLAIPTYPWGLGDINPKFQQLEGAIYYPYPLQDVLSPTEEERTYRALFLENEFLKVTCLPEVGGRIHSVFDKTTGEEMFDRNAIIKPGLVGLRGAWVCGGIEWNAGPQGHTVTCVSPVDALPLQNDDGSASLAIGNTEKTFRTRWTVKVTLRPGRSFLEEEIRLFNPTDGVHSYYFWNNTAFPCHAGTRFIYPMTLGCDHNGTSFFSWPVHETKDLTWLKNYEQASSIFAYKCAFDFFGAYDVENDRGIVQYANHHVLPGKKAWTWGEGDDAAASQRALRDDDKRYIEVQSGPLPTQANYGKLGPRDEVAWQEWWFPVHGLGDGFEYATRDAAIQTKRAKVNGRDSLEIRVIATGEFPGAAISVSAAGTDLIQQKSDLSPSAPAVLHVLLPPGAAADIAVRSREGEVLASFTTPLPIPAVKPGQPPWILENEDPSSAEELFLKGNFEDRKSNPEGAREWYHKALEKDASHAASLRGLAVLELESGLYEEAERRLEKALERDPDGGMTWFFLGVAKLRQGSNEEALDCGYRTSLLLPSSSLGHDLVGRALMRMGKREDAIQAFEEAIARNARDTRAYEHLLVALLSVPEPDVELAKEKAERCLAIDPCLLLPRLVSLYDPQVLDRKGAGEWFREAFEYVGEKDFVGLETSLLWANLGVGNDISSSLFFLSSGENLRSSAPIRDPLFAYYWMYYQSLYPTGGVPNDRFSRIAELPTDYVFPSHPEAVEVFRYATEREPTDANAELYLGEALAGLGRIEEAVPHWRKAVAGDPQLSVAWRNLGVYSWKKGNDMAAAEGSYRNAIEARPSDDTLYRDLAKILITEGSRSEAIALLERFPLEKVLRTDFIEVLSQAYMDEERYSEVLNLLAKSEFSNWEGRRVSHNLFVQAHIERGKQRLDQGSYEEALQDFEAALTYPEYLGVGRPANAEEAEQSYWIGKALAALGRMDEAKETWQKGSAGEGGSENQKEYQRKCQEELEKQ